jgi:hypothetical protein
MNGSYMFSVDAHSTNYLFRDVPPCGHRFDIQLSAYRGNPRRPDTESPLSNIVTWDGGVCPRTATVSFESLETGDMRNTGIEIKVGPIRGTLWAGDESRDFDTSYRLERNHTHRITEFYPRTDFTVALEPDDSLYLAARIKDKDIGTDDTLFNFEAILPPAEITTREYRMTNRGNTLVIRINVVPR